MTLVKYLSFLFIGSTLLLLTACGGDDNAPAPPPTISAPIVAGLFQPAGALTINFTITGTYTTGNVFTAQLSDGTGSFASPTSIGTLASLTAGTINATLPTSVANGTAYRIRVVASAPATTSPDNGVNLSITAPTITISVATANAGETFIPGRMLTITTSLTGTFATGNEFKLQLSNASGDFSAPTILTTITNTVLDASLTGSFLPSNTPAGNGYRYRWVSTNPVINGTPSSTISVVIPSLGSPTIIAGANLVAGGNLPIQITRTNGPWFGDNQLTLQLSDASGSFSNPVALINPLNTTLATDLAITANIFIPANTPVGSGYRVRALTTSPVTSAVSNPFSIGALPTLTLEPGTPTFTKLYSGSFFSTFYTMRITRTGTFNSNTTFRLQRVNVTTGAIAETFLSSTQISEFTNTGTTLLTIQLVNTGNATLSFRLLANGHAVGSNLLQMNVSQTALTSISGNFDTQPINFGTNLASFFSNSPTTINNKELLVSGDEPTSVFGATTQRFFIGIPMVSEDISTGSVTGRMIVHYLNAAGGIIAIYAINNVSLNVSGTPTAYTVSANGPLTLPRTNGTAGNTSISLEYTSAIFKMQ